jgi:hypothetical protein
LELPEVMALQRPQMRYAARMRNGSDACADAVDEVGDACRLVFRIEPALQAPVVGRDAGWTSIFVALHRLNAAKREHEAAR